MLPGAGGAEGIGTTGRGIGPCYADKALRSTAVRMTDLLDDALRWAAIWHDGQHRKAVAVPYIQHPMAVALMLDRLGFPESVVIAGLLHDAVEDTAATFEDVRVRFGEEVAALVAHCSERKRDEQGRSRPWEDRKRDHLESLRGSPTEARAIALADKLHNLQSIARDLDEGRPVWEHFNAPRDRVLWYYGAAIEALGDADDPRLAVLGEQSLAILRRISAMAENRAGNRDADG